jgi:hypothetical protein
MKTLIIMLLGLLLLGTNVFAANGDLTVGGNLCVGNSCTSSLRGGSYGYVSYILNDENWIYCYSTISPISCTSSGPSCPAGYTLIRLYPWPPNPPIIQTGAYSCFKN